MNFSYKIKNFKKSNIENRRFKSWLEDDQSKSIIFYGDEIYFNSMVMKGLLVLDKVQLTKSDQKIIANVTFNKWSIYLISSIYLAFYVFFILNVSNKNTLKATFVALIMAAAIYLFNYPFLKFDVKSSLQSELKK